MTDTAPSLWLTSSELAARAGCSKWAFEKRLARLLAQVNDTRDLYERRVSSLNGGGSAGLRREFNVAAIARDFPKALKAETITKLVDSDPPATGGTSDQRPASSEDQELVVGIEAITLRPPSTLAAKGWPAKAAASLERLGQLSLLGPPAPTGICQSAWEEALHRWRLVEPLLNGDWRKTSFRSKSDYVAWVAKNFTISQSTLYNWRARALARDPQSQLERGLLGLVDQPRRDKGTCQRPLTPAHQAELRANTLRGYNPRSCWRELRRALLLQHISEEQIPSYRQCLAFCHSIPAGDPALVRHGPLKFEAQQMPYMRLKHDDYAPMELAVLDHTQLDNAVDYFGRACFPWLTLWLDWHSRYPLGFWLAETPSSRTVAMATRMMFLFFGVPDETLTDQGKDIRGRYISGDAYRWRKHPVPQWHTKIASNDAATLRGVFSSAGVKQIHFARGRHPQTKGVIERFFRTIKEDFCPRFSAWRGNDKKERGEITDPLLRSHIEAIQRGESSPLVRIEDYAFQLFQWLYSDFVHREHSGFEMRGRTPHEAFRPRAPLAGSAADLLLLDRARRKISRCGVEIFNERFEPDPQDAAAIAAFYPHNGHWAEVRYDPYSLVLPDLSEVIASCCGQSFRLQCAQPTSLRGTTEKDYQARLVARARVRKLREQLIESWQAAAPDALTRVPLGPAQPKSETNITLTAATPVAPADPRYPRPGRGGPVSVPARTIGRTVFISDAVEEDAAFFEEKL